MARRRCPGVDWARRSLRLETANWPEERATQDPSAAYAVEEYLRTMLPTLQGLLGADDAQKELGRGSRVWSACSSTRRAAREMDLPTDVERGDLASARDFARWLAAILRARGRGGSTRPSTNMGAVVDEGGP